jgi:type IV secretory pathway TraG/TraD family ATPase VirD4
VSYRNPALTLSLGDEERRVVFGIEDLCRHTMIFGSSGSGKTSRAYNPMLSAMLGSLDAGAFIIAAKKEAVGEAVAIARRAGREALVVEPGSEIGIDLFSGSPDVDAMYLRDTAGRLSDDEKQWIDAAMARLKNALRMLKSAGNQYYTFEHLTSYCFDTKFAAQVRIQASDRLSALDHRSDEAWTIREALSYEDARYNLFAPETRRGVEFAISRLLEPLRDVHVVKTFARRDKLVNINSVFDGNVIILHVPRTRYLSAAHAIFTLAKRRFFTSLESRRSDDSLNQKRPVVFGIDEYQLCISESDIQSLGIIRSAGCMVLGTTQGVSSLYSVLPKYVVEAALQNFTQKIFFKTDDESTLGLLDRATTHSGRAGEMSRLFSMKSSQAFCHLTVGDESVDAILSMEALFVRRAEWGEPSPNEAPVL